eukprot:Rmarinus@m.26454
MVTQDNDSVTVESLLHDVKKTTEDLVRRREKWAQYRPRAARPLSSTSSQSEGEDRHIGSNGGDVEVSAVFERQEQLWRTPPRFVSSTLTPPRTHVRSTEKERPRPRPRSASPLRRRPWWRDDATIPDDKTATDRVSFQLRRCQREKLDLEHTLHTREERHRDALVSLRAERDAALAKWKKAEARLADLRDAYAEAEATKTVLERERDELRRTVSHVLTPSTSWDAKHTSKLNEREVTLEKQVENLEAQLAEASRNHQHVLTELYQLQTEAKEALMENESLRTDLDTLRRRADKADSHRDAAEAELHTCRLQLSRLRHEVLFLR